MNVLRYSLSEEGYVNRFITTGVFTEPQTFQKAILKGRVNEWLKKGFSIHENPCRKEFIEKRRENLPEYQPDAARGDGRSIWKEKGVAGILPIWKYRL